MRSRDAAALLLVAGAALFAGVDAWSMSARSTVPLTWHGTVTATDARAEDAGDVYFVTVGGDEVHVDASVAALLHPGDRVDKARWSHTLRVNGVPHAVSYSREARRMQTFAPLLVIVAAILVYPRPLWRRAPTRS
jgi:hypothetical protein